MRSSFDTNIAVYAFADVSDPGRTSVARQYLEDLRIGGDCVISMQVLKEFANVCTRKLRPHVPESSLVAYLDALNEFDLIPVDGELVRLSVLRHFASQISFYDALHVESAIIGGAKILYSQDLQHGMRFGPLQILNPFL